MTYTSHIPSHVVLTQCWSHKWDFSTTEMIVTLLVNMWNFFGEWLPFSLPPKKALTFFNDPNILHLISHQVLWYSPENNFTANDRAIILYNKFENYAFRITGTSPRGPFY